MYNIALYSPQKKNNTTMETNIRKREKMLIIAHIKV